MFVQTEVTPNPNSLKFLPGKKVSNNGPYEITKKDGIQNDLVRNILSVNGVEGIFLGEDFISVNKADTIKWEKSKTNILNSILTIQFRTVFKPRRGRINCSLNDNGKWRWFGVQFPIKEN